MNAFKSIAGKYLGHLVSYLGSALTLASLVPQAQLSPVARLVIGVGSFIVTAAHHGYQAGVGVQTAQTVVDAATKALASAPAKLVVAALMLCPFLGLHGCASVSSFLASPTGTEVVAASVDVAVATAEAKGVSAAQINGIAHKALAADSGAGATLAAVSGVVQTELAALKLSPGDQAAADILVPALSAAIQAKVGSNATLATAQADVAVVLNAVIEATGG